MKKRRIAIFLTSLMIASSSATYSLEKEKSEELVNKMNEYTSSITEDDFEISAHRGFSSLEVENTEAAIALAANQDYIDYIEIDARMTQDGKLVLSHNDALFVEPDTIKTISTLPYEEITSTTFTYESYFLDPYFWISPERSLIHQRKKSLNQKPFQIVGLLEGLDSSSEKKILLDLKFKNNIKEFTQELQRELEGIDTSNIIFQSLNIPGIKYVQEHTDFNCLALMDSQSDLKYINDFPNVGIRSDLITHQMMEDLIEKRIQVAVWTINSTKELDKVTSQLGKYYKDVIYITDYPDLIATKLHEKEKKKETT